MRKIISSAALAAFCVSLTFAIPQATAAPAPAAATFAAVEQATLSAMAASGAELSSSIPGCTDGQLYVQPKFTALSALICTKQSYVLDKGFSYYQPTDSYNVAILKSVSSALGKKFTAFSRPDAHASVEGIRTFLLSYWYSPSITGKPATQLEAHKWHLSIPGGGLDVVTDKSDRIVSFFDTSGSNISISVTYAVHHALKVPTSAVPYSKLDKLGMTPILNQYFNPSKYSFEFLDPSTAELNWRGYKNSLLKDLNRYTPKTKAWSVSYHNTKSIVRLTYKNRFTGVKVFVSFKKGAIWGTYPSAYVVMGAKKFKLNGVL